MNEFGETPDGLFTNTAVPSSFFAKPEEKSATPWESIGWVLFTILLFCAPAIVWAVWSWAL